MTAMTCSGSPRIWRGEKFSTVIPKDDIRERLRIVASQCSGSRCHSRESTSTATPNAGHHASGRAISSSPAYSRASAQAWAGALVSAGGTALPRGQTSHPDSPRIVRPAAAPSRASARRATRLRTARSYTAWIEQPRRRSHEHLRGHADRARHQRPPVREMRTESGPRSRHGGQSPGPVNDDEFNIPAVPGRRNQHIDDV
jgi:hypothetical protein